MSNPVMDDVDATERRVMGKLDALGKELIELRAENNMLKGVLASHADVRALISELRHIYAHMHNGQAAQARAALGDLLRRFDREST